MAFNHGWKYTDRIAAGGISALDFYAARHVHSGKSEWAARFARGEITVNGRRASGGERLAEGDLLEWSRPAWNEGGMPDGRVGIVYEDADIVAVDKPAGLATAQDGGRLENTLVAWLRRRYPGETVSPAHRLNSGASGLVICGRTPLARARLAGLFREKTSGAIADDCRQSLEKTYLALSVPWPGGRVGDTMRIETPIGRVRHFLGGGVFAARPDGGLPARSDCEIVGQGECGTLWRIRLMTGRPHQIRIHLASIGAPLAGDGAFLPGGAPNPLATPGGGGYYLRAIRLRLSHPATGRPVTLEVPPLAPPRAVNVETLLSDCPAQHR